LVEGGNDGVTLVTGATGHLGANLLRRLLADGQRVRVLLRAGNENASVEGLNVERAYGDLRDPAAIAAAVDGCARIYHTAAVVSTIDGNARHKREIFDSNVIGTRHLLKAAARSRVGRVVVSGSFSAFGHDLDDASRPVNETSVLYPFGRTMPYSMTKVLVEQECLRAAADGLPVVIATSTGIVGPHDYKPSRLGRTLCDFANGRIRFIVPGSHEFVSTRDIVEGHRLAMDKGRPGQSYLFSTEFLSLDRLLSMFAEFAGPQRSYMRLPAGAMLPLAEVASFVLSRVAPSMDQRFTPGAIRRVRQPRRADCSKATAELGFRPTGIREALAEAHAFHCARGAIRQRARASAGNAQFVGRAP
jgi:nucleoside-diphosphate-sugar epimerase